MMLKSLTIAAGTVLLVAALSVSGFASVSTGKSFCSPLTTLAMANDNDFLRWAKASRSAQATDNVVELLRPLGLVLSEDEQGNVYVETVAPKGNAARTGKVCIINVLQLRERHLLIDHVHLHFSLFPWCCTIP
jgi:hypothetical protein